jgi:hypothetical protein
VPTTHIFLLRENLKAEFLEMVEKIVETEDNVGNNQEPTEAEVEIKKNYTIESK